MTTLYIDETDSRNLVVTELNNEGEHEINWEKTLRLVSGFGTVALHGDIHPGEGTRAIADAKGAHYALLQYYNTARKEKRDHGHTYWMCFKTVYAALRHNTWADTFHLGRREVTIEKLKYDLDMCLGTSRGLPVSELLIRVINEPGFVHFNPAKEYLDKLPAATDEDRQVFNMLAEQCFNTPDAAVQNKLKKYLIGAVARVLEPGCENSRLLVLKGKQGAGKTQFFAALFGEFFKTLHGHEKEENAIRLFQHSWCIEMGEIDGIVGKKETEALKAMISETVDSLVPKYRNEVIKYPRHFVFAGTTNSSAFLVDSTGSRRFAVVDVADHNIPWQWVKEYRNSIWAVALELYNNGETWRYNEVEAAEAAQANAAFEVENAFVPIIEERIHHFATQPRVAGRGLMFTLADVMEGILNIAAKDHINNSKRVSQALNIIGYERVQLTRNGLKQRFYRRTDEPNAIAVKIWNDNGSTQMSSDEYLSDIEIRKFHAAQREKENAE